MSLLPICKKNTVSYFTDYWLCCLQTFSFCHHSGHNISPLPAATSSAYRKWGTSLSPQLYLKMTHGRLRHVKVTLEVTHMLHYQGSVCSAGVTSLAPIEAYSSSFPFFHRPTPPPPFSCPPHLCQALALFVMDDLVIKWERCWVSDRSLRSTWPSVISAQHPPTAPFFTHAYTRGAAEPSQSFSENPLHTCISLSSLHVSWFCLYICREAQVYTQFPLRSTVNLQIGHWTTRLHFSSLFSESMCWCLCKNPDLLQYLQWMSRWRKTQHWW